MDANVFWSVIGAYNRQTVMLQVLLLALLSVALLLAYRQRRERWTWFALGIIHLFIGLVFFGIYGTEAVQRFFAMPLFVACGVLFLRDGFVRKSLPLRRPTPLQGVLLTLYGLYPLVSLLCGHRFPEMVTYIMPCPMAYLGLVVYAGCPGRNKLLFVLLIVWGLTGVKSVLFHAYEDIILLLGGLYGLALLWQEHVRKKAQGDGNHQNVYLN